MAPRDLTKLPSTGSAILKTTFLLGFVDFWGVIPAIFWDPETLQPNCLVVSTWWFYSISWWIVIFHEDITWTEEVERIPKSRYVWGKFAFLGRYGCWKSWERSEEHHEIHMVGNGCLVTQGFFWVSQTWFSIMVIDRSKQNDGDHWGVADR